VSKHRKTTIPEPEPVEEETLTPLGELLEEDRNTKLMTLAEYASFLEVHERTLRALRFGRRADGQPVTPTKGTLEVVAQKLGYSGRPALGAKLKMIEEARAAAGARG
jgi:hypothetical protein